MAWRAAWAEAILNPRSGQAQYNLHDMWAVGWDGWDLAVCDTGKAPGSVGCKQELPAAGSC